MQKLVEAITPHATKRVFKKGVVLLYQGEAPRMAYVIKTGDIKVYAINNAGEEQIVTMHGQNDMFPGPWIFKKANTAQYYYETASGCEILTVPRDILRDYIFKPEYLPLVTDYLAVNYSGMLMRVTALQQARASEKILFTLYYLMFRYGREKKPGHFELQLPLTHTAIASLVGLTRETTTTELNTLKRLGIISYVSHIYTINKAKLEHHLGEDSFEDLKL